ncbi:MAG TPA: zinc ribbon domain-containing protein [bacterium]|nr:zinc ribbon domain-containing protein [bacterium]
MRCPQCGTENPPGKIVCRNCGTRLRAGMAAVLGTIPEEELMRRVRLDLRKLLIMAGITVALGIALGVLVR